MKLDDIGRGDVREVVKAAQHLLQCAESLHVGTLLVGQERDLLDAVTKMVERTQTAVKCLYQFYGKEMNDDET